MYEQFGNLLILLFGPVLRSVAGWAENALADNVITEFEKKKLYETIIRVGTISIAIYLGGNGLGFNVEAMGASLASLLVDKYLCAVKK